MNENRRLLGSLAAASLLLAPLSASAQADPTPTPTPPPAPDGATSGQPGSPEPRREGWFVPGTVPSRTSTPSKRGRTGGARDDRDEREDEEPWEREDPSRDSIFLLPTGRTLHRGELSLGFPGPGGIPDIQYGLSDWLQIGAGYSLVGFTPSARLGLVRGRRIDLTLVGGAYLPAGTNNPFGARYGGAVLSAGRDEFRVHLGYQYVQLWGDPFPDVRSVQGGIGTAGVELEIAPRAKFVFMVANYAQAPDELSADDDDQPYAVAVMPGVRLYGRNLSADLGFAAGQAYNVKLSRGDDPSTKTFVVPMVTLRYQL